VRLAGCGERFEPIATFPVEPGEGMPAIGADRGRDA
jgi:hypothetical protein